MIKKIIISTLSLAAILMAVMVTNSFANPNEAKAKIKKESRGNIDFKIDNNTGSEFKYCVNGGHNYISAGSTKSFSYSVGQDFNYIDGSSCGKLWFEVTSDMAGKTYKLSDFK
jgi:hypothetical protein